jgi:hypothetical protein
VQFPNSNVNNWMADYVNKKLPDFSFKLFNEWLDKIMQMKDEQLLLAPPMCIPLPTQPVKVKQDTIINGDLIRATTNTAEQAVKVDIKRTNNIECKYYKQGKCNNTKCNFVHNNTNGKECANSRDKQKSRQTPTNRASDKMRSDPSDGKNHRRK